MGIKTLFWVPLVFFCFVVDAKARIATGKTPQHPIQLIDTRPWLTHSYFLLLSSAAFRPREEK